MDQSCDIGIVGLGVMGAALARNFASRGCQVAGYNRSFEVGEKLAREHPEAGISVSRSLVDFAKTLKRPRRIILLVPAGPAVDEVIAGLEPLLEEGDILVDAGNSHYQDTDRRMKALAGKAWRFLGMGLSGGEEGALKGPALMPGGERAAYDALRPLLERVAAPGLSGPCVGYCGKGSAGHFAKMVHNGIEYADMQLIAEVVMLMRRGLGLTALECADVFRDWNRRELESYLVEITARVLSVADPQNPEKNLVDAVLDKAGQKGTGKWTLMAAAELGVSIPSLAAAVDARLVSYDRDLRCRMAEVFPPCEDAAPGYAPGNAGNEGRGGRSSQAVPPCEHLSRALYATKLMSYAQGFDLLQKANLHYGYGMDLSEIARLWTGGCIIRARFLEDVVRVYLEENKPQLLMLAPFFADQIQAREKSWREVVEFALSSALPVPCLSASLSWFDNLRNSFGTASLIQAQRDFFGSHRYERMDNPGIFVHTEWNKYY